MRTRLFISRMVTICLLAPAAFLPLWGCSDPGSVNPTRGGVGRAVRGDLTIAVTESGQLQALEMEKIRSEVEGRTRILSIVPEGMRITEEDVKAGKVLVQLDSSSLAEKLTQQEITFAGAEAGFTQAKEAYDIQVNQNESNIKAGELKFKFARMDLNRYLGDRLTATALAKSVKFVELASDPALGGAALQERRKLKAEIDLAREEVKRAGNKLDWTEKLSAQNYVSKNELEADRLALQRRTVELDQAKTALELSLRYEFPKQAEQNLSDLREAQKELERIRARARSEMAKAEAELRSKEAQHNLQRDRLEKQNRQIKYCTIRAEHPGLVVYGGGGWRWHRSGRVIEEGGMIRHRQVILRLPDVSTMIAEVKVHESAVDKVKIGQTARITVDAFPDEELTGKVTKLAVLPDTQNRWLNPDLKEYKTEVSIQGTHAFLKPGMTVRVEILAAELRDVLTVPIQAVSVREGLRVCYVKRDGDLRAQLVQTGQYSDKFVQITDGLNEGDKVLLHPAASLSERALAAFRKAATKLKEKKKRREVAQKAPSQALPAAATPAGKDPAQPPADQKKASKARPGGKRRRSRDRPNRRATGKRDAARKANPAKAVRKAAIP